MFEKKNKRIPTFDLIPLCTTINNKTSLKFFLKLLVLFSKKILENALVYLAHLNRFYFIYIRIYNFNRSV